MVGGEIPVDKGKRRTLQRNGKWKNSHKSGSPSRMNGIKSKRKAYDAKQVERCFREEYGK